MNEGESGRPKRPTRPATLIVGVAAVIVLIVVAGLFVMSRRSPRLRPDVLPPTGVPGPAEQPRAVGVEPPAPEGVTAPPESQEYATALLEKLRAVDPEGGWAVDWSDERVEVKTTRAADDEKAPTDEEIMKMCLGTRCPSPEAIRVIHDQGGVVLGREFPRSTWDPDYRKVEEERAKAATLSTEELKALGIEVYPGAKPLGPYSSLTEGGKSLWLETADPLDKVAAFYRNRYAKDSSRVLDQGWRLDLQMERENETITIRVDEPSNAGGARYIAIMVAPKE